MADEKDKLILARDSHRIPSATRLLNTEPIAETDIVIDVAGSSEVKKSKKSKKSKEKKKEGDSGKEKKKKHHRERPAETPAEDGGREKTRVFQIMDFSFFVKKRGFAGGGSKSQNT